MNGYEFMAQHPVLTGFLVVVVSATFSQCVKYLTGYEDKSNEQKNQEEES